MKRILLALNSIKVTQQTHSEYFSLLLRNTEDAPLDPEGLPDLPFSTEQDFVHFDKELEVDKRARLRMSLNNVNALCASGDRTLKNHYAYETTLRLQHMLVQGGDTPKERTTRILRSILSSSVAAEYSWCGAKGKHKFSDLNICKILCILLNLTTTFLYAGTLTYRQNLEEAKATKKDIEKAGMSWLRHAAERAAAEKKSMGRKDATPFTLD
ncbi:uncharacterized protein LOC121045887 [Ixodes scapularis]|uniref:uncharacterized protein LOC121045887 n=1 Tax=Ixodes scapularis TaxID=6945 RepID=UPI001AD6D94D|nr:uncharacterized protein LOC121045887 [Ixodes scapularis]